MMLCGKTEAGAVRMDLRGSIWIWEASREADIGFESLLGLGLGLFDTMRGRNERVRPTQLRTNQKKLLSGFPVNLMKRIYARLESYLFTKI